MILSENFSRGRFDSFHIWKSLFYTLWSEYMVEACKISILDSELFTGKCPLHSNFDWNSGPNSWEKRNVYGNWQWFFKINILIRSSVFPMYPKARVFDNPENPIYVISYEKNDWYAIREASIILMFTAEVTGFVIPVQIYMRRAVKKFNLSEHSISIQKTFLRALHLQVCF